MGAPIHRVIVVLVVLLHPVAAAAAADGALTLAHDSETFLAEARRLMGELRVESRRDALRIQRAYAHITRSAFPDLKAVVHARTSGRLAALPTNAVAFNIQPRLLGPRAIGELDVAHQASYVAARPGTLGCLLHVAAAVRSTALDVTSLVRHLEYQRALSIGNVNARTHFRAHALGLAFDVSIINGPLAGARELRDALRYMRSNGDLFFVAETRQLVFHVVPRPERLPFYAALYESQVNLLPAPESRREGERRRGFSHLLDKTPPSNTLVTLFVPCLFAVCFMALKMLIAAHPATVAHHLRKRAWATRRRLLARREPSRASAHRRALAD